MMFFREKSVRTKIVIENKYVEHNFLYQQPCYKRKNRAIKFYNGNKNKNFTKCSSPEPNLW